MTDSINKTGSAPFTHTAYFFIRTGMIKGRVYGYWKDGGRFRAESNGDFFSKIDMLPRGGWDGRIRFVKIGNAPPSDAAPAPQRPGHADSDHDGEELE